MGLSEDTYRKVFTATIVLITALSGSQSVTVKDIFGLNADPLLLRVPRDNKYFLDRYGSASSRDDALSRTLKPEDSPEARDAGGVATNVEKRCSGCDSTYQDYRSPYDSRYESRYTSRGRNRDRYYDDRDRTDRYDSNYYDRYDDRDRYYDRDRYSNDRRPDYYNDRYDRDRYDTRDRGYDSKNSYRPWDETYRGSSGWDSNGRGYYFATGRPENTGGYGSGYASSWNYGRGDDRDRDYRTRDQGYYGTQGRPRDYYDYGYRGTSYLYARPSSSSTTTSSSSPSDGDNSVTDAPRDPSPSDPIFFNIKSLPLKIIDKKSV